MFIHVEKNNFFQHRKNYKKSIQAKQVFAGNANVANIFFSYTSRELLEATTLHLISFTAEIIWLCIPREVVPTFK